GLDSEAAKDYPAEGRSALSSGVLTGVSLGVISLAAAAGAGILSHEVAKGPETDGFFAAYGVYLVLVLVASAFRFVVLPALTRAGPRSVRSPRRSPSRSSSVRTVRRRSAGGSPSTARSHWACRSRRCSCAARSGAPSRGRRASVPRRRSSLVGLHCRSRRRRS